MRTRLSRALLAVTGAAHLLPATALASRGRLEATYGIAVSDPDIEVLLRHRATFFGLLGGGMVAAAALPRYRTVAISAGLLSLGSFVALVERSDRPGARLQQIARLDVALAAGLVAAAWLAAGEQ